MTQIRKFIPVVSEYAQTVAIEKANFPEEELTVEAWQWQDQQYKPTTIFSRWVGEWNGRIVSHAYFIQEQTIKAPDVFRFHLAVHPEFQGKGFGTEMLRYLNQILTQYSPCRIHTTVREDHPHAMRFLEHRALHPTREISRHRICIPSSGNSIDLTNPIKKLQELGFNFCTLQDAIQQIPAWKTHLLSLFTAFRQECNPSQLETFDAEEWVLANKAGDSTCNPESIFLARYHQHWIGIAGIQRSMSQMNTAFHTFTGVLRPHRRNGIAGVLIQLCINAALLDGYTKLEVDCQKCIALEQVYQQSGYQRLPLEIQYELSLPHVTNA